MKLGLVVCRPDCHGRGDDKNTVLFYTQEDMKYNRLADRKPRVKGGKRNGSAVSNQHILRESVWRFENSGAGGLFDMDFANNGMLDLRLPDWKERLEGHIGTILLKRRQREYVRMSGGWGELRESDARYNSFNRSIITYMKKAYGRLYLGSINYYGDQRERILSGKESVYEEYTGQTVYNFSCAFAVPEEDARLEEMIRDWSAGVRSDVDGIIQRICEIGGEHFIWY